MARKKKQCMMDGCDNDAAVAGVCKACYSYMRYWQAKTPTQVIERMHKVRLFERRLDVMLPSRTAVLKQKRRGRA